MATLKSNLPFSDGMSSLIVSIYHEEVAQDEMPQVKSKVFTSLFR
jgi:hypothetical protein